MKSIMTAGVIIIVVAALFFTMSHGSQSQAGEADIMARLDEVAKGQQEVVAAINSMKDDIQIIKIRITQLQ